MGATQAALQVREDVVPAFAIPVDEAERRIRELQSFVKGQMAEGTDYGKIPGTDKPTLLKPGAEKLAMIYGFAIEVEVTNRIEDWERGFFAYECVCRLANKRTGVIEAMGVGSCNSKEARYRWRFAFESELPEGIDRARLHKVTRKSKRTGQPYTQYRLENDDPYTLVNTVLKMAKKRAVVDAVLSATRSSGLFTQDIEDFPDFVEGEAVDEPERPAERKPDKTPSPTPPGPGGQKASERSAKALYMTATKDLGWPRDEFLQWLEETFGTRKSADLSQAQVSWAIDTLKSEAARRKTDDVPFFDSTQDGGEAAL